MRKSAWSIGVFALLAALSAEAGAPLETRVHELLRRMTLEEKVSLLGGDETGFATRAIPRLGLPAVQMTDGPLGVRYDKGTAFPSGISMGATFHPELIAEASAALALETRAQGRDMILAPCVNLSRHPFGGRNFESFGEDPYLSTQIGLGYWRGLKGKGILPSLKHFGLNEQEFKRKEINVIADERTMHELHFPMFRAIVKDGVWNVMASYNRLNGHYASENAELLTETLKKRWGFTGFVVSDWWATHSTVEAAEAGLDLEMPFADFFGAKLLEAVRARNVSEKSIDDKVARVLRGIIGSGVLDAQKRPRPEKAVIGGVKHLKIAEKLAAESLVLLKNDAGANGRAPLPLDPKKIRQVAVIGPGARHWRVGGGGSSMVNPTRVITPLQALRERAPNVEFPYAPGARMNRDFDEIPAAEWGSGLRAEYFENQDLSGDPKLTRTDRELAFDWGWNSPGAEITLMKSFSARWTATLTPATAEKGLLVRADDGVRLWLDGELALDAWDNQGEKLHEVGAKLSAGKPVQVKLEFRQNDNFASVGLGYLRAPGDELAEAEKLAAGADAAVLFLGLSRYYEGEEVDRDTMALPEGQDELIRRVARANPNTVVVLFGGNPVAMPWIGEVKTVLQAWYPGQEGGYALADTLLGRSNPSGKLPVTFPKRWEDSAAYGFYPEDKSAPGQVTYGEGIFLGYRHFDAPGKADPLFPFGHGLSYTKFDYKRMRVKRLSKDASNPEFEVRVTLTNSGPVAGAEVVQLYVGEREPLVARPVKELKGFKKIFLRPGETSTVSFRLDREAFAYYDLKTHDFAVNPGQFELRAGGSSRALPLQTTVKLKE